MLRRRLIAPTAAVAWLALTATAAGVAPATAADGSAGERRGPTSVTFTGMGFGHGKGLSQYGARNRANDGQTYRQIVSHYYPGTQWGRTTGAVRVRLDADTTTDVVVLPRTGLRVQAVGKARQWRLPSKVRGKQVTRWRIVPQGTRSEVQARTRSWRPWRTLAGDAQFTAGRQPITLVVPGGRAAYRGILRSTSTGDPSNRRDTVNVVPMESYLRGVVPQEVAAEWPAQAVRAQAVAARTYAAFERRDARSDYYDLCDTDACQVYEGYDAEHPLSDAAVRATARRVVTYQGRPIFAQFSASNGGWSVADARFPYLRAEADPFDHGAPEDPWTVTVPAATVAASWPDTGELVSIEVTARDGNGEYGGRATEVTVTGTGATHVVDADTFRGWFDLRSTLLQMTYL